MSNGEPSIHDFPWLIEDLGLDMGALGTVMLNVDFRPGYIARGYEIGVLLDEDLHTSSDESRWWVAGDVTDNSHVTILYGLLEAPNVPGEARDRVLRLLDTWLDWRIPSWLPISGFEAFPSTYEDEEYACIVARVEDTSGALAEARGLLEYLPHVNTFLDWKLHATVAYVEPHAQTRWLSYLNNGPRAVEVRLGDPLNLGETKPTGKTSPSTDTDRSTE